MAEKILPVTRRANVGLVINDHLEIARGTGRGILPPGAGGFFQCRIQERLRTVGHGAGIADRFVNPFARAGETRDGSRCRLLAIGPVFATGTKPTAKPVTLEYVRWAAANVTVPWFAIGGINLGNLGDVLAAGAKRICIVSAILNAPDVAKACAEFQQRLQ